jgi:hypothetical protein
MTIDQINELKVPIFKVNPALNALLEIPMFEDKIAEVNEILRTVGLPIMPKQRKIKSTTKKKEKQKKPINAQI